MNVHPPCARPLSLDARTAADLMTPNLVSIQENALVKEAMAFLIDKGVSAAPVINETGRPVGVLSQTDLMIHARQTVHYGAAPGDFAEAFEEFDRNAVECSDLENAFQVEVVEDTTTVRDVMTPTVFSVPLNASAERVIEDMLALKVHRLFVTDDAGVLVGVISALDVLARLRAAA